MKTTALLLCVMLAGCAGHIQANFPPGPKPAELPESFERRGERQPMLWDGDGFRAFFVQWIDLELAFERAEKVASTGLAMAANDARDIRPYVQEGIVGVRVAFYFTHGAVKITRGSLEIKLDGGDVVNDHGAIYWDEDVAGSRMNNSRNRELLLDRRLRPRGQPLYLMVLLPREYMGRGITAIRLKGGES